MKGGRLKRWINLGGALGAPLRPDEERIQGGRAPARGEVPVAKDVRPMALCTPFKTGLENLTEILLWIVHAHANSLGLNRVTVGAHAVRHGVH